MRTIRLTLLPACLAVCGAGLRAPAGESGSAWADHPVNAWVKQSPREGRPPPPRTFQYEGGAAYDPWTRKLIHHGGHEGIYQTERTFAYDLETGKWEQRFPNTSPPGACCLNNNGPAFDVTNRRLVRFGGASLGHGFQFSRSVYLKYSPAPVWTYDPATNLWVAMRPPPYKAPAPYTRPWAVGVPCAVSAYDPVHEVVIHWSQDNLYAYDAYANQFDMLPAKVPDSSAHGMAIDPLRNRLVAFGVGGNDVELEKTRFCDLKTGAWDVRDLTPRPPAKKEGKDYSTHPVMAYDSLNDIMLCVVWHPGDSTHETWVLDCAELKWIRMNPPAEPEKGGSRARNLAYSEEHNVFILEMAPNVSPNQILTYRYKNPPADKRPRPPVGLEVLTDVGKAARSWQASPTPGVKEYKVYRAEAEKAWQTEYKPLGAAVRTSFTDNGLAAGKVYFYKVAAVGADGSESKLSASARTQPRALIRPVVSVLAKDKVEVSWDAYPAKDLAGYNVYRGVVKVTTIKKGKPEPWRPNDPEYPEPLVNKVEDITGIVKLNDAPVVGASFTDAKVDLAAKGKEAGDYRYAVYAYIVRAVNKLGTESGPSPYALTIPSEPVNVLVRNKPGGAWEAKWESPEKGLAGYRVYMTQGGQAHNPLTPHAEPPLKEPRFEGKGEGRLWVSAVDALGQEGQPSSPANVSPSYKGHFDGEWHQ